MREIQDIHLFRILIGGFALLIILLAASVYVGMDTMRSAESNTAQLLESQRAQLQLIEQVQSLEDSLSAVFYELAAGNGPVSRSELLGQLNKLELSIRGIVAAGLASGSPGRWPEVKLAVSRFIDEGRVVLTSGKPPSVAFYRAHGALLNQLEALATYHFDESAVNQHKEMERSARRVRLSVSVLAVALGIAFAGAALTIRVVNRIVTQLRFQTEELSHLSSRTMADQEATARRFSREMHDEFGQNLSAIEANLVAMNNARQFHAVRLEDCLALVKQAIENTRELSQLLRPSVLDDFGLDASIHWIGDSFAQRTGIQVNYQLEPVGRLADVTETHLFRIFQEALTNVARHASATAVRVALHVEKGQLVLTVADNGKGLPRERRSGGLGLVGMRARARDANGSLDVESSPGKGVTIKVTLPLSKKENATENSYSLS